jgi:hypothetical protein
LRDDTYFRTSKAKGVISRTNGNHTRFCRGCGFKVRSGISHTCVAGMFSLYGDWWANWATGTRHCDNCKQYVARGHECPEFPWSQKAKAAAPLIYDVILPLPLKASDVIVLPIFRTGDGIPVTPQEKPKVQEEPEPATGRVFRLAE